MINIVYLVLVISIDKGLTIEKIPQANIKQCEINKSHLDQINYRTDGNYKVQYKAHCIVGVK